MINYYLKIKSKDLKSEPPTKEDIRKSQKILFSIFTRYGDTIIDLVVIKEFINKYPNKEYLIICPKQMEPYVHEILPNIECYAFNKRNLIEFNSVVKLLKNKAFDIGFNPWSNGSDSCFYLSFCKKFLLYKDFEKPKKINHYQVVRQYLKLPDKEWKLSNFKLKKNYSKILICPHSTDINRNIPSEKINTVVYNIKKNFNRPQITIASMDSSCLRMDCENFILKKSANSSNKFLSIMKQSSLVICSDSGPLHIALALRKDVVAFMSSTKPQNVFNTESRIICNLDSFFNDK